MAFERYVGDLAYLRSGAFSDLDLEFGEKSWQIHKVLAVCHSKWFEKNLTIGMEESQTGVVTLKDDPEYLNAIDCMVSYFYQATYDCGDYSVSEPLLHAQVAILADKYVCHSLYDLARTSFSRTIEDTDSGDWGNIAAFVYDYTTTEVPAHIELRDIVVGAVARRHSVFQATLQNPNNVDLFRSNADLATDLLLGGRHGSRAKVVSEHHFVCGHCHYSHAGLRTCPNVICKNVCPSCGKKSEKGVNARKVIHHAAFSCPACDGFHSLEPEEDADL